MVAVRSRILPLQNSLDARRVRLGKLAAFLPYRRQPTNHSPQPRPFQSPRRSQNADHLRGKFARFGFRIERRHYLLERLERQTAFARRSGFALHAAFPLYWITSMVMSSDCAAPSVNTRMPSRIASPSCVTFSPAKSSTIWRNPNSSNNSLRVLVASETPSV